MAELPPSAGAMLIDLQAASRPAGLLNLLGMALACGSPTRSVQAMTLADLAWPALRATPEDTPVLVGTPASFDLRHASHQLCFEELVRRAGRRPVRLVMRALVPSSTGLLSRLIEAVQGHPDLQLWLSDAVSLRYAVSLVGPARARLVPPPLATLAAPLRQIGERQLIRPAMLGAGATVAEPDLTARFGDPTLWWQGYAPETVLRLGPALARVLGLRHAIKGPLLQQAWATALTGWATLQAQPGPIRTGDLDLALLAGMCGRAALIEPREPKVRDFLKTWCHSLPALGIRTAGEGSADAPPHAA